MSVLIQERKLLSAFIAVGRTLDQRLAATQAAAAVLKGTAVEFSERALLQAIIDSVQPPRNAGDISGAMAALEFFGILLARLGFVHEPDSDVLRGPSGVAYAQPGVVRAAIQPEDAP